MGRKEKHTYRAVRINNPGAIGLLAPMIEDFAKQMDVKGISYESLYTYFCATAQFGGAIREFWVIVNELDEVKAFANWFVCGLPHVGKVCCDYIHSSSKSHTPAKLLFDEFEKFAGRANALWLEGYARTDTTYRYFKIVAERNGYDVTPTGITNFNARKRPKEKPNENLPKDKD